MKLTEESGHIRIFRWRGLGVFCRKWFQALEQQPGRKKAFPTSRIETFKIP